MFKVYGMSTSGNCHKVRMVLEALKLPYAWNEIDTRSGTTRTPEFLAKNDGKTEARLKLQPHRDMEGNFLDVLRGNGRLNCNAELGAATMVAIKLAVESYRQKRTMLWDAKHGSAE